MKKAAAITGLGPIALALLKKRHAKRTAPLAPKDLKALLARTKRPCHAPALAFEKAYGGLSFTEAGASRGDERFVVGPGACLSDADLDFTEAGAKGLVPVIWAPNDVAYFVDASGAGWAEDTIEDPAPVRVAADARAMLTRLLLGEHVFACAPAKKAESNGADAAAIAKSLKLAIVKDASGADERWWSDGKTFLVERGDTTTLAFAAQKALARLAPPAPSGDGTGPVTFDTVHKGENFSVSVVCEAAGTAADAYAAFLDATRHAPPAAIDPRTGGAISLAGGTLSGTITALEPGVRVQLLLAGNKAFAKKTSRVEIFFRTPLVKTLVNVFQFGVKSSAAEAMSDAWWGVLEPWSKRQ